MFRVAILLTAYLSVASSSCPWQEFQAWKRHHDKHYSSELQEHHRFGLFKQSMQEVGAHNSQIGVSYKLGLNRFADLTWEEFQSVWLGAEQNCSATDHNYRFKGAEIPDSIDWRDKGAVSEVKDQGQCGSCWTFSSTGALESHYFLKYGQMKLFSEQQLVDCAQQFDNNGCSGGLPSHAFQYLYYNGGIETEANYPYQAVDQKCNFTSSLVSAKVAGSVNITFKAEDELVEAIGTVGPVSVAFQVAKDFRLYDSGVYDSRFCRKGPKFVNHAVLAVGYGHDDETDLDYYIIKNSWSEDWGEEGYFKMRRGVNQCGIADCASYPIIA